MFAKIDPLPRNLQSEIEVCKKPCCHCAPGKLHGPYRFLRWREQGRLRRRYVRPGEVDQVRAALEEWRWLHPLAYRARQRLDERATISA